MDTWLEYAAEVESWDEYVAENPCPETYLERWQARLRHPSWTEKREWMLWLCSGKCERCGTRPHSSELQLHHIHYDSLWYESHQDLQLLCPPCHRKADLERAEEQASRHTDMPLHERALRYMEIANRGSGQTDWPVSYQQALDRLEEF